ncbi:MFS sugar transporter [Blumeria hordei DH14]|uniref:MFS sugar transporter n=1 Tax=Blumeria graminis f. sp. hordei (strain DH14) TaxID=546991 RepID=N1JFH3_BLUG1|nr:MFS sugar transporter [Blumeria hordei DH14]
MIFLQQPRGVQLSLAQIVLVVAPGFILYGYNQSSIGGLLSLPSWTETFPEIDTTHTQGATKSQNATLQGLVVATFVMGALVGCMACMYLGDILGRRKCIFIAAMLTLIGEVICMSSVGLGQLVFGRVTIGCAIGIISSTIPVWQAECSPPAHRGKHVVLDGVFTCLGFALASWVNLGSSQANVSNPSITWRLPLAVPIIFSALLMPGIYVMPESPRWLIKVGRFEQASEVLSLLKDLPVNDPIIINEVADMRKALESDTTKKATLRDMFTMETDKLFYRFCLCILLQFYQQMSGSNLISVYAPVIFEQNLKLSSRKARLFAGGTLTWKFLSSFVAFFTIDRFGRKALFMFSGLGMGVCMLILAITTGYSSENAVASYVSVIVIFLYNFFVPIGFLGANFLYCAEVAPVSLRVGMSAISTANHWLWNFVVVMSTPVAIASIGHWYFILYATIGLSIPLVVWLWFPETMGQTLEEIDQVFRLNEGFRNIVNASVKGSRDNKKTPDIKMAIKEKDNILRQDLP